MMIKAGPVKWSSPEAEATYNNLLRQIDEIVDRERAKYDAATMNATMAMGLARDPAAAVRAVRVQIEPLRNLAAQIYARCAMPTFLMPSEPSER